MNGEKLYVEGYGEYEVEWHLAADLKTLKCMFGIFQGAMAKYPCLYCMAERGVSKGGKEREWKSVNANSNRRQAPNRDAPGADPNWDPILAIPLIRVHICVLHALVRIIEKLVYMYIKFAWIMKPTLESERTI